MTSPLGNMLIKMTVTRDVLARSALATVTTLCLLMLTPNVSWAACTNLLAVTTNPGSTGASSTGSSGKSAAQPVGAATTIRCANPTVTLTSPVTGTAVIGSPNATFTLSATASSVYGSVSSVAFYNGATLIGTVTGMDLGTYTYTWTGVAPGSYSITARAIDCCGGAAGTGTATSKAAAVTVTAGTNNATFVSQSVPALVSVGQSFPVSLTFTNSGNTTWTAASNYRLGSQNAADNTTWGTNRIALPANVAPGGSVTFSTNVTAPATGGSYNFQWRMVQDGVAWFGATSTNVVVVDNAPPVVSLAVAGSGAQAPASLTLTATASDPNDTVAKVEFYNGANLLGTKTAAPFTFSWTGVPVGSYSLTAKAYDTYGAVTTSTAVTAGVVDAPPVVNLVVSGSGTNAPATLTLNATATDANDTISKVEFYWGTTLLATKTTAPYQYAWAGVPVGTYGVYAKAYDSFGLVTSSNTVAATVNNAPPTVSLSVAGSGANAPANLALTATASDVNDNVTKVEFYNGATLISTATTAPYSYTMASLPAGSYSLSAKAYDTFGAITTSNLVAATINPNIAPALSLSTHSAGTYRPNRDGHRRRWHQDGRVSIQQPTHSRQHARQHRYRCHLPLWHRLGKRPRGHL
jgi:Bacterial Ig domain/Ig-like domain from next to BRCA1 gene